MSDRDDTMAELARTTEDAGLYATPDEIHPAWSLWTADELRAFAALSHNEQEAVIRDAHSHAHDPSPPRRGDLAAVEAVQIARFWRGLERYGEAVLALERMRMQQVADSRDVTALMKAVPDAAAELVKRHRHWIRRAQDAEVEAHAKANDGPLPGELARERRMAFVAGAEWLFREIGVPPRGDQDAIRAAAAEYAKWMGVTDGRE
jgi:uncharacterized protein YjiS (DUF1127 family)